MGISALQVTALLTALLFSVTSNLTNYHSYRYNAVTVTNKETRSITIFQQTDGWSCVQLTASYISCTEVAVSNLDATALSSCALPRTAIAF